MEVQKALMISVLIYGSTQKAVGWANFGARLVNTYYEKKGMKINFFLKFDNLTFFEHLLWGDILYINSFEILCAIVFNM